MVHFAQITGLPIFFDLPESSTDTEHGSVCCLSAAQTSFDRKPACLPAHPSDTGVELPTNGHRSNQLWATFTPDVSGQWISSKMTRKHEPIGGSPRFFGNKTVANARKRLMKSTDRKPSAFDTSCRSVVSAETRNQ